MNSTVAKSLADVLLSRYHQSQTASWEPTLMDLSDLRSLLRTYNLPDEQLAALQVLADGLPESHISANIVGLSETESAVLLSRVLRAVSRYEGIQLPHADAIGVAGFVMRHAPSPEPAHDAAQGTAGEAQASPEPRKFAERGG